MPSVLTFAFEHTFTFVIFSLIATYTLWTLQTAFFNVYLSPLSKFPGPRLAAASDLYKTVIEGILSISWHTHLEELHARYGPVVRVGPNELHFSEPKAYHDIYNNLNKWDKEIRLYHSFGEDRSSFGFLTYKESKERKDVLNKSFSSRAILEARGIIQSKIDDLCSVLLSLSKTAKAIDLSHAYRCMTIDIITTYCFGTSVNAIHAPDFHAPIVVAMDASSPVFVWFKHSSLYKNMIMKCPRPLSRVISPPTAGLVDLQEILEKQINNFVANPKALEDLPHRMTIYHSLLDESNYKTKSAVPSSGSLYEEAQALMFAGADTVGQTLMVMTFYMLQPKNASMLQRLRTELKEVYVNPSDPPPPLSKLEALPYLNAVIKEALRMNSGVITGLPRIVPSTGANIAGTKIPAGTIVSIGSTFVHYNPDIFPEPETFNPSRWLSERTELNASTNRSTVSSNLDEWLVPFSRGPRSCLGINLAWLELRLSTATVFRRIDMELDKSSPSQLIFKDTFLPHYVNGTISINIKGALQ